MKRARTRARPTSASYTSHPKRNTAAKPATASSRKTVENCAIFIVVVAVWFWVFCTVGLFLYHGYYSKPQSTAMAEKEVNETAGTSKFPVDWWKRPFHPFQHEGELVDGKQAPPPVQVGSPVDSGNLRPFESPLLIFTCKRAEYLRQTLDDVLKYLPTTTEDCIVGCPIIISQDGKNEEVRAVIEEYQQKFAHLSSVGDSNKIANIPLLRIEHTSALRGSKNAYEALAKHYGWALQKVFSESAAINLPTAPQRVIILEEDIHIAPDFFSYFQVLAPLLDRDPTLFAISAFNDNGFTSRVMNASRVLRSDFFPGLGWMMTRKLWINELALKWPSGYWDDWLREPVQRQDRQVLRPEVSRTFHFGKHF
jgi:GNT-I family